MQEEGFYTKMMYEKSCDTKADVQFLESSLNQGLVQLRARILTWKAWVQSFKWCKGRVKFGDKTSEKNNKCKIRTV